MINFVPISQTVHAGKAWRRPTGYTFASTQAIAPLVSVEFAKAAVSMPIAFIKEAGRYVPVAVMSPIAGRNLFIGPNGRWLGAYVPAALRAYPFRFGRVTDRQEAVLGIDQDSVAVEGTAESFFEADGSPSPTTKVVLEFLTNIEVNRKVTEKVVGALAEAGLIQPWSLKISTDAPTGGEVQPTNGLYRVDETVLNALDDESFIKLRKSSALPLAYLQLFSMGQVSVLAHLIRAQRQLAPANQLPPSLDDFFAAAKDETVRFNFD